MSVYPHSHLFLGPVHSVVVSGPHLQVVESQTGNVVHSTVRLEESAKEAVLKSGAVRCAAIDSGFKYVVTSGEDKQLKVWEVDGLKLLSERELPKKPTEIQLTRDGQTILVSDKFGDVFSYPLHPEPVPTTAMPSGTSKRGTITSHENPSNGTLILGHTSLLTTFILTEDERFVISADRDEHIRVSWYPQGYVIERYCLGHEKYVSAIHIPRFAPSMLLSGGGDPTIKLWEWKSGELVGEISIGDIVERYIKIKAPKSRFGRVEDDGGEGEKTEKPGRRKGRGRRNGKGKDKAVDDEDTTVYVEGAEDEPVQATQGAVASTDDAAVDAPSNDSSSPRETDHLVLAVQRIASADVPGQGQFFVFSAVGATALFFCPLPSPKSPLKVSVNALDLGKPIIDFTVAGDGYLWVLVDGERSVSSSTVASVTSDTRAVRLVKWVDGKLVEISAEETVPLLTALNTTCLLPATATDLKALDIYSALVSLPKNVDPEHDPLRRGVQDDMDNVEDGSSRGGTPQAETKKGKTRELTQREIARMKNKRAVMAKIQEQEQAKAATGTAESVTPEDEPESKKAKQESDGAPEASEPRDVIMADAV